MNQQAFAFNTDAPQYKAGAFYAPGTPAKLAIAGPLDIYVSESTKFTARVPDIFSQYKLPSVNSNHVVDLWGTQPLGFWQNQINLAVHCATTGCGVSAKDHLGHPSPMISALYQFHAYYQVRRILTELHVALPQDPSFNAYENAYDNRAYQRICSEFGVTPSLHDTDWKRKGLPNYGLGKVYTNGHPIGDGWYYPNFVFGWRGSGTNVTHDYRAPSGWMKESFTEGSSGTVLHADCVMQGDADANTAWTTFVLDDSQGFTQAGVVRLNDSIMVYVWAILGAQAQTRTDIIGTGQAFEAQKQFLALVEDAIAHEIDLPSEIKRYQDVLQHARSKVDFVYGIGLYMAPSDMLLRVGQIQGFNNLIVTATAVMTLGSNAHVNAESPPPSAPPIREPIPAHHEPAPMSVPAPASRTQQPTVSAADQAAAGQHNDEKTALTVGLVAVGLIFLWWSSR